MPGKIFPNLRLSKRTANFKENDVFRGVSAWADKNACVGDNGGPYDLYDYADGYFDATRGLLELAMSAPDLNRPWIAIDILVYPICLNFRHAIELYIKYLITALSKRAHSRTKFKANHSLLDNWIAAKGLIASTALAVKKRKSRLLTRLLDQFTKLIQGVRSSATPKV